MKQFLKDNWVKLPIIFAILVVVIAISYYFVIYLPKERTEKGELANQIKCQQDGTELYNSQKKEMDSSGSLGNPEFKFNKDLKTCLYKNIIIGSNSAWYFIIDVYTNKEIVSWSQIKSQLSGKFEDFVGSEREWKMEVYRLFDK